MLKVGDAAPEVNLLDQNGEAVNLADLHGKTVVLYFYPKADTPGCTRESEAFRDTQTQFDSAEAVIIGVSPDPVTEQQQFAIKYGLPFQLLADTDRTVAEAFGVWTERSTYGRNYLGIEPSMDPSSEPEPKVINRTTFVIGPDGKIARIFPKVQVDGHAQEVLEAVQEAQEKS